MPTIQVFEYEKLGLTPDKFKRSINRKQFDQLCSFNDRNKNKYFTIIRDGVKFCHYVGVIQIGNLTIEILPKTDKLGCLESNDSNIGIWRNALLKMLSISEDISLESVSEAELKKRSNSLLDLYFDLFITELQTLLHKGLIKKYRSKCSNVLALKGSIQFSKNIQKNLIHQERFFTDHQVYDHEHLFNIILLKGLSVLENISPNSSLYDKIRSIRYNFPEISNTNLNKDELSNLKYSRKTEKYKKAINIAKMLILNYSPDIKNGKDNMLALLFNMNDLWEKYIYKAMKKGENDTYSVKYHQRQKFWNSKQTEPDIILTLNNKMYIIDTKWKIIEPGNPSMDDLKQMYVYNMYWDASRSLLLYPTKEFMTQQYCGKFHKGKDTTNECKLGFVNVLNENGELNKNISEDIIKMFN